MNCYKVQSLISAYADCELPGVEMLAVRQHLNQCSECNLEFESLLSIKRAYGTLQPGHPASDLPARILQRLDQVSHPPHEQFLASLSKRFSFFPAKARFAAVGMAVFTILLTIRSSQVATYYASIPLSPTVAMSNLAETSPAHLLPATSMIEKASFDVSRPKPPAQPWGLSGSSHRPTDLTSEPRLMPAGYKIFL